MELERVREILSRFAGTYILTLGDCMLDQWVWGSVTRISPEAPIPVVDVQKYTYTPGGAANVGSNLSALGARTGLIGVVGKDIQAKQLKKALKDKGVETRGIIPDPARPTTQKTRIIAHHQQVVRADLEQKGPVGNETADRILDFLAAHCGDCRWLIISDYDKGLLTRHLVDGVMALASKRDMTVTVGPKPSNINLFKGAHLVTLNEKEASKAAGIPIEDEASLTIAGERLLKELKARGVLITRGEKGMALFTAKGERCSVPALASQVFDVSGAGDTVIAVATLCLACGATFPEAIWLANHAAAVVVKKVGTATLTREELLAICRE
jgi:D-beta-D-heptose 7-phosphate kinase/D-beta-D-heptose 1-phosphate adenosyltransferase